MGLIVVLDTNIVIYLLSGRIAAFPEGEPRISIVTEIELLSNRSAPASEEQQVRVFLSTIAVVGLDETIKNEAINLRKAHGLRLPDAIIAGTAQALGAELLTNDLKLLNNPAILARPVTLT